MYPRAAPLLFLLMLVSSSTVAVAFLQGGAIPSGRLRCGGRGMILPRTHARVGEFLLKIGKRNRLGAMGASTSMMTARIEDLISGAAEGGTIILQKGIYTVQDSLLINKDLTIAGEKGVPREDIVIRAQAPHAVRHCLASINDAKVCIKGVSFDYPGGSYDVGLGTGKEAICLRVQGTGRLEIEDCEITTGAGAAIVALGGSATVYVSTCKIGPCGWELSGLSGYGVAMMMGARGEVINCDIYRTGTSGVLAYGENTKAKVVMCDIGPCVLSCMAAEGARTLIKARDVTLRDAAWRQIAELNGGIVEMED